MTLRTGLLPCRRLCVPFAIQAIEPALKGEQAARMRPCHLSAGGDMPCIIGGELEKLALAVRICANSESGLRLDHTLHLYLAAATLFAYQAAPSTALRASASFVHRASAVAQRHCTLRLQALAGTCPSTTSAMGPH